MMAGIKKEMRMGIRSGKILILFTSLIFFAMMDPMMAKFILPVILKSQLPGITGDTLDKMLDMSQTGSLSSYMGDIFEIGSIIIAFVLGGVIAQEIKDNTLVFPICTGKKFGGIIGSKFLVFGLALILAALSGLLVCYLYSGLLFTFEINVITIIIIGLLYGLYMCFILSLQLLWGALTKNTIATGFLTLGSIYSIYFLGSTMKWHDYLPSGLIVKAQGLLTASFSADLLPSVMITVAVIIVLVSGSILKLKMREWNER